jgi:hypothetical protein
VTPTPARGAKCRRLQGHSAVEPGSGTIAERMFVNEDQAVEFAEAVVQKIVNIAVT